MSECQCNRARRGPLSPDQCIHCWQRVNVAAVASQGMPLVLPCIHLGEATGETVKCQSCTGEVRLKLFRCGKHTTCTQGKRVAGHGCCDDDCRERDPGAIVLRCTSHGVGDVLLCSTTVAGVVADNPGKRVIYQVLPHRREWVELLGLGCEIVTVPPGGAKVIEPTEGNYDEQNDTRLEKPRWQHYADVAGTKAVLPRVRPLDPAAVAWAAQFAGHVVLAPWSAWRAADKPLANCREWLPPNWLELERLLAAEGISSVIVDHAADRPGRDRFRGKKVIGQSAARLAALASVGLTVSNDSGMAHLAGVLGAPALVLCGQVRGDRVYGLWPSVRVLQGPLACSGCHWQGKYGWQPVCDVSCASLQAITPAEVLREILAVRGGERRRRLHLIDDLAPLRQFTAEMAAEQKRHLKEDELYTPGKPRLICSVLGALHEELSTRPDLQPLVEEATWMARRISDAGAREQKHLDWHVAMSADGSAARPLPFLLLPGIGDSLWSLTKVEAIMRSLGQDRAELVVAGNPAHEIGKRAVPFLRRFRFVKSVEMRNVAVLEPGRQTDPRGRYRYVRDGRRNGLHYLMPNAPLERGERLETWLPEFATNFDVMDSFSWQGTEAGDRAGKDMGDFVALYLGPMAGNTGAGHNRGPLWRPEDWVSLAGHFIARGLRVAVVGAAYDHDYYLERVRPLAVRAGQQWADFCGVFEIGETLALLRRAKCFVSYQCGLAMVMQYLGTRVVSWWRPDGDSLDHDRLVSFDERFRDAWTHPKFADSYLGLVYGRQSADDVAAEVEKRGWLR